MDLTPARAALRNAEGFLARLQTDPRITSLDALQCVERTLNAAIISVRDQYNSSRPVNCLPPEILRYIFRQVLDPVKMGDGMFMWPSALRSTKGLQELSFVCHLWRQITLDDCFLWSHIHIGQLYGPTTDMFLQRSARVPLKVCSLAQGRRPFVETLSRVERTRIEELCISSPSNPHFYTSFAAPALRRLTLQSTVDADVPYLVELFRGAIPQLCAMSLHAAVWLPSNCFPRLTRLYLSSKLKPVAPHAHWTLSALSAFLSNCPVLEALIFGNINPTLAAGDEALPVVNLHRLRSLSINSSATAVIQWLLVHLLIPVDASIGFRPRREANDTVLDILLSLPRLKDMRTMHLRATVFDPDKIHIITSVSNSSSSTCLESTIQDYTKNVQDEESTSRVQTNPAAIGQFSGITHLHVADGGWVQKFVNFPALFMILPYLSFLEYEKGDNDLLPLLLKGLLPPDDHSVAAPIPCKSLTILKVSMGDISAMFESIVEFANNRHRIGYPLAKCIVLNPAIELDDMRILKQYVETVEVRFSCPLW
ncbi:hypothetical protein SCP_1800090 [Sparassis crispa]|uniref:F-box domain-containing protein n=1 Tax=Sparassis crispa TaxID=139825 RepID=A0A401H6B6_9APHY|nr:hypothetical protein SCP_1800090 [Sparassis crispa]GBE89987.1 hypothetical protein SCP_1800090 [Sparassis crispa]